MDDRFAVLLGDIGYSLDGLERRDHGAVRPPASQSEAVKHAGALNQRGLVLCEDRPTY
ncbi:MAG: hypothetical protein KIS66_17205 [Fimbriimonadaceae bacterium]|nr:hypothetical protein [Fimbriimonadaceae bacterium]